MMRGFGYLLNTFSHHANRAYEYGQHQLALLLVLPLVVFPALYISDQYFFDMAFDTFGVRLAGVVAVCVAPLIYSEKCSSCRPYLWLGFHAYLLLFLCCVLLLMNAAATEEGKTIHFGWTAQYLCALFLFVLLFDSLLLSMVCWVVASILAVAVVLHTEAPNWSQVIDAFFVPIFVWLTAIFVGSLANRNIVALEIEKAEAARVLAQKVAERLQKPLEEIAKLAKASERQICELVEGYSRAVEEKHLDAAIPPRQLRVLSDTASDLLHESRYAETMIQIMLQNVSSETSRVHVCDSIQASGLLSHVVERFPFSSESERNIVSVCVGKDFTFTAPRLLVEHVLINLVKNALYYVGKSNVAGDVCLICGGPRSETEVGRIVVCDSGVGIQAEALPRVFDRFYTTTPSGSGIGLNFARTVMNQIGGDIQCESVPDEYTRFTLIFRVSA